MNDSFDMIVIGAGPAGEKAAVQAAFYGKRVAVVDQAATPGGSAVQSAGVPTKTLRETALYLTGFQRRDTYGLSLQLLPSLALERLLTRTAEVIATRTASVQANLDRNRVQLLRGQARLGPGPSVIVRSNGGSERTLRAGVVLIATGSKPLRPPDIPFEDPDVHDSETIIGLDRIPQTMVVIGGGPVGCEYASVFTALGVEVTLLDRADRVLPFMDTEISDVLARAFAGMGMRLTLGSGAGAVARVGGQLRVTLASGERLHPEKVLFVAGRAGTTEGLGLPEAGVKTDALGPPALASVSMEQGRVAATHAFGIDFKQTLDPLAPYGVYSIPEAAMVGMTEQAAKAAGIDCEVGRGWFAHSPRAQIAGSTEGLIKLVFRRDDRRLLGVHIVGELATELIHHGQAAIGAGEPIDTFIDRTFNIPTYSETYKYAAYDGLQRIEGKQP